MSKVSFHLLELQRYLCEYTFVYTGMNPHTTTFSAHVTHTFCVWAKKKIVSKINRNKVYGFIFQRLERTARNVFKTGYYFVFGMHVLNTLQRNTPQEQATSNSQHVFIRKPLNFIQRLLRSWLPQCPTQDWIQSAMCKKCVRQQILGKSVWCEIKVSYKIIYSLLVQWFMMIWTE